MERTLTSTEHALTITNEFAPFNVVAIVRFSGNLSSDMLRQALDALQHRHPLLRTRIARDSGHYRFVFDVARPIDVRAHSRTGDEQWLQMAQDNVNRQIDWSEGPLLHCDYLQGTTQHELILTFHHAVMDAASGANLLHELLSNCAAIVSGNDAPYQQALEMAAAADTVYPAKFRGIRFGLRAMSFMMRQAGDEISFRVGSRGKRQQPIRQSAQCKILPIKLPATLTTALAKKTRRERLSLNSALNAALLLAVSKRLYAGQAMPLRYIMFADLRPYLKPAIPADSLGCYFAMLRYTIGLNNEQDFWELVHAIHKQVHLSIRRGDKFIGAALTRQVMEMTLKLKSFRMAATALSYSGPAKLKSKYDSLEITGLHGFISNNMLGPEFTGQARLFDGEIWCDFLYLDSDMNHATAQSIANDMVSLLESGVGL